MIACSWGPRLTHGGDDNGFIGNSGLECENYGFLEIYLPGFCENKPRISPRGPFLRSGKMK